MGDMVTLRLGGLLFSVEEDVAWTATPVSLAEFWEKHQHNIPQLIKVEHGYKGLEEFDDYSTGDVMRVAKSSTQERVVAKELDKKGVYISIPTNYPVDFQIIKHKGGGECGRLKDLLRYHRIPFTVRFLESSGVRFFKSADQEEKTEFGSLQIIDTYEERYLLANNLAQGEIYVGQSSVIPLYLPIKVVTALGPCNQEVSRQSWQALEESMAEACLDCDYKNVHLNNELTMFNEADVSKSDGIYDYIEPSTFISFRKPDEQGKKKVTSPTEKKDFRMKLPPQDAIPTVPARGHLNPASPPARPVRKYPSTSGMSAKDMKLPALPPQRKPGILESEPPGTGYHPVFVSSESPGMTMASDMQTGYKKIPDNDNDDVDGDVDDYELVIDCPALQQPNLRPADAPPVPSLPPPDDDELPSPSRRRFVVDEYVPVDISPAKPENICQPAHKPIASEASKFEKDLKCALRKIKSKNEKPSKSQNSEKLEAPNVKLAISSPIPAQRVRSTDDTRSKTAGTISIREGGNLKTKSDSETPTPASGPPTARPFVKVHPVSPIRPSEMSEVETTKSAHPTTTSLSRRKSDRRIENYCDIPEDISGLTVRQIGDCLQLLHMEKTVKLFEEQLVDGALLSELDVSDLKQEFGLSNLEAKKLHLFAQKGWRPGMYAESGDNI